MLSIAISVSLLYQTYGKLSIRSIQSLYSFFSVLLGISVKYCIKAFSYLRREEYMMWTQARFRHVLAICNGKTLHRFSESDVLCSNMNMDVSPYLVLKVHDKL